MNIDRESWREALNAGHWANTPAPEGPGMSVWQWLLAKSEIAAELKVITGTPEDPAPFWEAQAREEPAGDPNGEDWPDKLDDWGTSW